MQRSMLSPAQAKEFAELAKDLEKPTYNQDGTLNKEFFIEAIKLCWSFNKKRIQTRCDEFTAERRQALKDGF
jgi:hypothetical protein